MGTEGADSLKGDQITMYQGAQRWREQTGSKRGAVDLPALEPRRTSNPTNSPTNSPTSSPMSSPMSSPSAVNPSLASARTKPKRRLRPVLIVAVLLLVGVIAFVLLTGQNADPLVVDSATGGADGTSGLGGTASTESGDPKADQSAANGDQSVDGAGGSQSAICIYISGAVGAPGVVELPAGARLADAINACGGLSGDAAAEFVNLAAQVEDGMHIHIPRLSEVENQTPPIGASTGLGSVATGGASSSSTGSTGSAGSSTNGTGASTSSALININTADQKTLETLPGIGEVTAQRIVAYRETHGSFKEIAELKNVSGIGNARYTEIESLVTCR
jgi:competence ComEA-like helix-hairpin-helix protein